MRRPLHRDIPGLGPARNLTTGVYSLFELMGLAHDRSLALLFLLYSLFSDAPLDFPRLKEWEATAGYHHALFTSFDFRSQDILLWLTNQRICYGGRMWEQPKVRRIEGCSHESLGAE